jgi:hypothetical protein
LALNVLHDDEAFAFRFTDFVDTADIWMIQCCRRPGFSQESLARCLVPFHQFGQEFERHPAIKGSVVSQEDLTHSSRAQLISDPVVRDGLADFGHGSVRKGDTPSAMISTAISAIIRLFSILLSGI